MSKKLFFIFIMLVFTSPAMATMQEDADRLFDWAGHNLPEYFSPAAGQSQQYDVWYYRYYDLTGNYIGVNDKEEVYVVGKDFPTLTHVGNLDYILTSIGYASTEQPVNGGSTDNISCTLDLGVGGAVICLQGSEVPPDTTKEICEGMGGQFSNSECASGAVVKCQEEHNGYTYIGHYYENTLLPTSMMKEMCRNNGGTVIN